MESIIECTHAQADLVGDIGHSLNLVGLALDEFHRPADRP